MSHLVRELLLPNFAQAKLSPKLAKFPYAPTLLEFRIESCGPSRLKLFLYGSPQLQHLHLICLQAIFSFRHLLLQHSQDQTLEKEAILPFFTFVIQFAALNSQRNLYF
jgi:hypothetical protein